MRVLHVIDSLNRGGAEVMLSEMAPKFRKWGITCDVIALIQRPSPLEETLRQAGVNLRYTGVKSLNSPLQVRALARFVRGYDIVHVHLFPAQLWMALASVRPRCQIPIVTTEHNTWNGRRKWWFRPVDVWMYSRYSRIACVSQATAEHLAAWCPAIVGKIDVIPNGIALDRFERAEPATLEPVSPHFVRLVFVGRFDPQKDHETLFQALTEVPNAQLILVGDGPLRCRLEKLARSLGIIGRVSFLGWREDVAGILKASDLYVHSTHSDGFGIAACEAMAAGLPVVASDVPGLAQVVDGAGILVPAANAKALAQSLNVLVNSPEQRKNLGHASLSRARQFSIESTVQGYSRMYETLLGATEGQWTGCNGQS